MSSLDSIRRFAIARTLFTPTTLQRAIERCGFVQADPIRAPARAQDLTLRHRVRGYRAGDLERRFATLQIEEDVFVNYGFMPATVHALLHPREPLAEWPAARRRRAQNVLNFVRDRGAVHPRDVDRHFSHGTVVNYWGGWSSATTHLMEEMHYAGLLRVIRREGGVRIYAARDSAPGPALSLAPDARLDALVDVAVRAYAPLPAPSLSTLVSRLRYAAPQLTRGLKGALRRAQARLAHTRAADVDWFWPAAERMRVEPPSDTVLLLSPFDPLVWDRRRFEMLWGWAYRFEAYTPAFKRKFGYYALPMLWRNQVVGWGNISVKDATLQCTFGYTSAAPPRDRTFKRELEAEMDRMRVFLRLSR